MPVLASTKTCIRLGFAPGALSTTVSQARRAVSPARMTWRIGPVVPDATDCAAMAAAPVPTAPVVAGMASGCAMADETLRTCPLSSVTTTASPPTTVTPW